MSFGWSGSDVFLLAQLAWNTFQNSRKACGEYDGLTREAMRLHAVLQRLNQEVNRSDSPINRPDDTSREQLELIASDCGIVLKQLDKMVGEYAALSEEKRSTRKIWQKVRFSNGQMADLGDLRSRVTLYTSEMLFYVNLVSMGTVGRIEQQMTTHRGVLRELKVAVEKKTAHSVLSGANVEGTILTRYADDDTGFWKALRRELVEEGLPSAVIHKHKHLIKAYVKELGTRGVLDDGSPGCNDEQHAGDENSDIPEEIHKLPSNPDVDFDNYQEIRDESPSQDSDLQAFQDLHLSDGVPRERAEAETNSRPQLYNAKAAIAGGSRDRPRSSQEKPKQASARISKINYTSDSDSDRETEYGKSASPPNTSCRDGFGEETFPPKAERVQCAICLSDGVPIEKMALLACQHRWCNSCLRRVFTLSTTDRQYMPPKCCTKDCIDLEHVVRLFDNVFKRKWNRKYREFTTKDPLYCPSPCGSWIKPAQIHTVYSSNPSYIQTGVDANGYRTYGRCQRCRKKVCAMCKTKWHSSRECPKDACFQ